MMLLTELEKEKIMEILMSGILPLNCIMKKILFLTTMGLLTGIVYVNAQSEKAIPPPPPPPPKLEIKKFKPPVLNASGKSNNEFIKRNPTVANIWMQKDDITIIKLRSGKEEKYNLKNETEKKSFIEKYGEPPMNPPKADIKKFKAPPPPPPKPKNEN
jgi:hypothetical protein